MLKYQDWWILDGVVAAQSVLKADLQLHRVNGFFTEQRD